MSDLASPITDAEWCAAWWVATRDLRRQARQYRNIAAALRPNRIHRTLATDIHLELRRAYEALAAQMDARADTTESYARDYARGGRDAIAAREVNEAFTHLNAQPFGTAVA